jgi:hypothetical protein
VYHPLIREPPLFAQLTIGLHAILTDFGSSARPATAGAVFVGNISSTWQVKSGKGKAALDVSWSMLRNFLKYKSDHAGVAFAEVDERYTTQTCSDCGSIGGPKGIEGLGVRQWVCSCGSVHDRDRNAAVNIARIGCDTLGLKWLGSPSSRTEQPRF